jgi:hypothetical protein
MEAAMCLKDFFAHIVLAMLLPTDTPEILFAQSSDYFFSQNYTEQILEELWTWKHKSITRFSQIPDIDVTSKRGMISLDASFLLTNIMTFGKSILPTLNLQAMVLYFTISMLGITSHPTN